MIEEEEIEDKELKRSKNLEPNTLIEIVNQVSTTPILDKDLPSLNTDAATAAAELAELEQARLEFAALKSKIIKNKKSKQDAQVIPEELLTPL